MGPAKKEPVAEQAIDVSDFLKSEGVEDAGAAWSFGEPTASEGDWGQSAWNFESSGGRAEARIPDLPPFEGRLINLPYDVTDANVKELLLSKGLRVTSLRLPKNPESGQLRGYGFVTFEDRDSLAKAVRLEGLSLLNRVVRIEVAEQRSGWGAGGDDNWRSNRRGMDGDRGGFRDRNAPMDFDWSARREPPGPPPNSLDWSVRREPTGPPRSDRPGRGGRFFDHEQPQTMDFDWNARREPIGNRREHGDRREHREPREPRVRRTDLPDFDWSVRREPSGNPGWSSRGGRGPRREQREPREPREPQGPSFTQDKWPRGTRSVRAGPESSSESGAVKKDKSAPVVTTGYYAVLDDLADSKA